MDLGNIKGIKYTAPVFDNSGYAKASRDYILALHSKGVPITINPVSFEKLRPNLGKDAQILNSLVNKKIDYNINLIHLTPEHIPIYREENKKNINLTVWETDRIHREWVAHCGGVDALIVPCKWNVEVFKNSGVDKPIGVVPHGIDIAPIEAEKSKLLIEGINDNDYVFYSIGQWTERKNPYSLLRCFYSAFAGRDDVVLLFKTYGCDNSDGEIDRIVKNIINLKRNMKFYPDMPAPRLVLVTEILSESEMLKLHNRGDCYVSLAHAEGWGLGYFHAMAAGKPTIGVGGSGNEDFMNSENSWLVDYTWSPTLGMPYFNWYTADQMWPEPNLKTAITIMKEVEANRDAAATVGAKAREDIKNKYTHDKVSDIMISEINRLIKE